MIESLPLHRLKKPSVLLALLSCAVFTLVLSPFIGAGQVLLKEVFTFPSASVEHNIFWQMRLPRVLVGFLVGGILALSGMVFQSLFRNPLVSPFTLGVSAGASFGAAVYIWLRFAFTIFGISGTTVFSYLGALVSIYFVWSLAKMKFGSSISKMLLAGVAVSFFFVSLIMFIQYLSDYDQSVKISRWLMGGLYVFGYDTVRDMFFLAVIGLAAIFYFSHELNLLTTGEEIAVSRGVDLKWTVKGLFLVISLMMGGIVSICGPIGFVDIIAPHVCRLLIGHDHRYLTPATFLLGGAFLVLCDTFARTIAAPAEIPVGVITALLGGPFFLWLLRGRGNDG